VFFFDHTLNSLSIMNSYILEIGGVSLDQSLSW
jgi:hypothetical protein